MFLLCTWLIPTASKLSIPPSHHPARLYPRYDAVPHSVTISPFFCMPVPVIHLSDSVNAANNVWQSNPQSFFFPSFCQRSFRVKPSPIKSALSKSLSRDWSLHMCSTALWREVLVGGSVLKGEM
jgi:hypothetical protein